MSRLEAIEQAARFILGEDSRADVPDIMRQIERNMIDAAMERCSGNKEHAARLMNMKRTTLIEKLRRRDMIVARSRRSDKTPKQEESAMCWQTRMAYGLQNSSHGAERDTI